MKPLQFESVKSLVKNGLSLNQAEELQQLLKTEINRIKTNNIKTSMMMEYSKYPKLEKYVILHGGIPVDTMSEKELRRQISRYHESPSIRQSVA